MTTTATTNELSTTSRGATPPRSVLELLDALRQRIRWYVIVEGVAMFIVWLVSAFWIGLAIDYLPVLVGANEMPRTARSVWLAIASLGAVFVLYWYIFRRVFKTFRNTSLALLIEKQFPTFRDSLVTTVEMGERTETDVEREDRLAIESATSDAPHETGRDMFARTVRDAESAVRDVQLSKVFSYRPLVTKLVLAVAALTSLLVLGVIGRSALGIGASRLLLLTDEPWPRRSHVELVGFDVNGERKIAKGTDLIVRVRADAGREFPPPELCSILYETSDGDRGRVNMSRDGEAREDGFQYYVFNGKPFKSVLNDIQFDVIGGDYRLRDQRLLVVASPVVTGVLLRSELPTYTGLLPREETWTPGLQLPIGSRITARIQSSKNLVAATIKNIDSGDVQVLEFPPNSMSREVLHQIDDLSGRVALSITLTDTDGIESLEPYLLAIGAVEDEVPNVDVALRGIGNAITPQARLAVEGSIKDDYQIERAWYDVKLGDEVRQFDLTLDGETLSESALDLREEGSSERDVPLTLKPEDRIVFSVKATDKFDLDGQSHVGSNDSTTLTVVRPDELLAILDGRELGLRRRFEQIRSEMLQSRDSLSRLRASFSEKNENVETSDDATETAADVAAQNVADLRDRLASWAAQKSEQTALEVDGVALAFEDIREELINNRVDSPERKSRMEDQIIAPLREIADVMFPDFRRTLGELRATLATSEAATSDVSPETIAIDVTEEADRIIVAMDAVLEKMLEMEDYAEIVNIVRELIEQQDSLQQKTKAEQEAGVLDLFK